MTLQAITLRRIALFVDGAARAAILPFGPLLIGNLLYGMDNPFQILSNPDTSSLQDSLAPHRRKMEQIVPHEIYFWDSVAWITATLVVAYMLGHALGALLGQSSPWIQRKLSPEVSPSWFYRAVGVIVALHFFSFGTTLNSHGTLFVLRFFAGLLVGIIHRVTSLKVSHRPKRNKSNIGFISADAMLLAAQQDGYRLEDVLASTASPGGPLYCLVDDEEPELCKNWLAGFAISITMSGLMYYPLHQSGLFVLFSGQYHRLLSFACFAGISVGVEICLHYGLTYWSVWISGALGNFMMKKQYCSYSSQVTSRNFNGISGGVLRRRKGTEETMHQFSSSFNVSSNVHWNRDRLDSNNSRGARRLRLNSNMSDGNRSRLNSNVSNDLFFDCASDFGGFADGSFMEDDDAVAKYSDGLCVYDDGTPAAVPVGTCTSEIPAAYVELFGKTKSETKWIETQNWRIDNNVWKTHRLPHPWFQKIKAAYPHYVHGYTKMGYPVVYEKPGAMKLKELFREGLQVSDMLRHYIFFMEFLNNVVCNRSEIRALLDNRSKKDSSNTWGFFVVMDVEGASLSAIMSGDVVKYLKQAGDTNTNHYPTSMQRCILVNAPFWLSGAFSSMKYIVPESVQVDILSSSNRTNGLRDYINDDQIPREYGGSSMYALGEHPFETDLNDLVEKANKCPIVDNLSPSTLDSDPISPSQKILRVRSRSVSPKKNVEIRWAHDTVSDVESCRCDGVDDLFISPLKSRTRPKTSSADVVAESGTVRKELIINLRLSMVRKSSLTSVCSSELVLLIVSIMHGVWCAIQGSLETALPLWLLYPPVVGGLGYEPLRTSLLCFFSSIFLIILSRTKVSRIVSRIPACTPMRGYRIGVGIEAILLAILALIPSLMASVSKKDSWLIMASNIFVGTLIFVASVLGRSSSAMLHRLSSASYINVLSLRFNTETALGRVLNTVIWFVKSGQFTYTLGVAGEISGALVVAPLFFWSTDLQQRPFPLDATFCFYTGAFTCLILYLLSFSLHADFNGGLSASNDIETAADSSGCMAFTEAFSLPAAFTDTIALLEKDST